MKTKLTIGQRGDPFEARELREMVESRAFNVYAARVDQMIEQSRAACEQAADLDALRDAQGALKALRRVRELPKILTDELQQRRT